MKLLKKTEFLRELEKVKRRKRNLMKVLPQELNRKAGPMQDLRRKKPKHKDVEHDSY